MKAESAVQAPHSAGVAGLEVSVVVAVFNPGRYIEACIDSLLGQSLPNDRYEVILVDDGSTDGTPKRLDELAALHDNVIVRHEPRSGWSGRPRNVGIGLARGEFVFICDHDDWLSPEALERMCAYARRTGADVLAPKIVGHGRGAPTEIFERNVDDARFATTPLMFGLAPHKLFRRGFLREHGLTFGEGRRFEDQVFVTEAYLLAARISVLADYPCYHHVRRADEVNAAFIAKHPADHVSDVAEVLDVIERNTEPGPERDLLMRRPYQREILSRFSNTWFLQVPPDDQLALLNAVSGLLNERFPASYDEQFGAVIRVQAAAIRAADFEAVRALAERVATMNGRADLLDLRSDSGVWLAEIEAEVEYDGTPVVVTAADNGRWHPDRRLLGDDTVTRPDSTEELLAARVTVEIVGATSAVNWFAPHTLRATLQPVDGPVPGARLVLAGTVTFDPSTLAGGRPLEPDLWEVRVRIHAYGDRVTARLRRRAGDVVAPARPALVGTLPVVVTPTWSGGRNRLGLEVKPANRGRVGRAIRRAVAGVRVQDDQLVIDVGLDVVSAAVQPVRLVLTDADVTVGTLEAGFEAGASGTVLRSGLSPSPPVDGPSPPPGRYRLAVDARKPVSLPVYVTVGMDGRVASAGLLEREDSDHS